MNPSDNLIEEEEKFEDPIECFDNAQNKDIQENDAQKDVNDNEIKVIIMFIY